MKYVNAGEGMEKGVAYRKAYFQCNNCEGRGYNYKEVTGYGAAAENTEICPQCDGEGYIMEFGPLEEDNEK